MTDSHTEEPSIVSSSMDVGQRLREARESKKISITDAAAQLRVTREAIVHLEEQNWDKLHGRTYARGYFLSYAKFLGLPQDEMLAGFNVEFTETNKRSPSVAPIQQLKPAKPGIPWLPLFLLIIVAILSWFAYQQWQATQVDQVSELPEQPLIEPLEPAKIETDNTTLPLIEDDQVSQLEQQPDLSIESNESEPTLDTDIDESTSDESIDFADTEDEPAIVENTNQNNLIIGINSDCWVEVRDANQQILISRVVRGGNTIELSGVPPLRVSLGQASAASVRFEGNIIDVSEYTRGDVARFTLGEDS